MTVKERAVEYHNTGCNCAQSVLCALHDYTGLDDQTAQRISAGFGGGARCGELCGAITGGIMALGLANDDPNGTPNGAISKQTIELTKAFRAEYGCVRCQDLTIKFGGKTHCSKMIETSAALTEKIIQDKI
ncbi:MAG: C-GCAxxG-C-C family protein [Oscillospiraceae bacterium]|nr:C-GCAxxG-C-C family protein [Oscillospiraceae bacterium]MDY6095836.1 C-GCAxxG-C-C family protein [Oscillospiraceae bacterium]